MLQRAGPKLTLSLLSRPAGISTKQYPRLEKAENEDTDEDDSKAPKEETQNEDECAGSPPIIVVTFLVDSLFSLGGGVWQATFD